MALASCLPHDLPWSNARVDGPTPLNIDFGHVDRKNRIIWFDLELIRLGKIGRLSGLY